MAGLARSVTAVASDRGGHVLAVLSDGSVAAWGHNDRGQLGDGTRADADAAVVVRDVQTAVAVATGGAHSLALLRDGSVVGWGDNEYAQIGGKPLTYRTAPVQVGGVADLPSGAAWPRREGRPMAMLAQIDLAEAAPYLDSDEPVPREGLLTLFVDPGALDEPGSWQLWFTEAGVALTQLPLPPELAGEDRLAAARVIFEREMSWPTWESAALDALGLSWPQLQAYGDAADFFEDRPIHRMLGHPTLLQPHDPHDADPEMCLLLQIDTDDTVGWSWGDVGCLYIWIAAAISPPAAFDRAVLCVQSA